MKKTLTITLALLSAVSYCQSGSRDDMRKKLTGKHWAGNCKNMQCDTMEYSAFKKYDGKRYQWASGYIEGMEFITKDTVVTFHNVLCSDESSPVDRPSRWELKNDTLIIDGYYLRSTYRILSVSKKELRMLHLGFESK